MPARGPTLACFAVGDVGHVSRLLPLVEAVAARGAAAHVYTRARHAAAVRAAGGTFHDLFAGHAIEEADDESVPMAVRFVTFAGTFAEDVFAEVAPLRPTLVVCDTFAVVGRVVAGLLGVPWVNLCAGHGVDPDQIVPALRRDLPVRVSERCARAVGVLRDRYGLADASPFCYAWTRSPWLNLYGEPEGFLPPDRARALVPVACFGSLPAASEVERRERALPPGAFGPAPPPLRVLVSFGTVVWRYFAKEALAALEAVADAVGRRRDAAAVVGLGGHDLPPERARSLARDGVRVEAYFDQWGALREATHFVTHHGLNSTHEAIFHRVPMLSYPFFWDQPALASRCQALGIARPLAASLRGRVDARRVDALLDDPTLGGPPTRQALDRLAAEEALCLSRRPTVVDAVLSLALPPSPVR